MDQGAILAQQAAVGILGLHDEQKIGRKNDPINTVKALPA